MSEEAKKFLRDKNLMNPILQIRGSRLAEVVEEYHQKQSQWISVEDRLPETYCQVLIYCPQSFPKNCRSLAANYYADNKKFYCDAFESVHDDVTHWMLLPTPST